MPVRRTLMWILAGIGMCGPGAAAAQDEVRRITLPEALESFARNSLALRIARAEAAEVTGYARQDRAYANPILVVGRETLNHAGAEYWETTAGLSQAVEWPGRTAARGRRAGHTIDAAAAAFRADSIRLAFEVREAYARAWLEEEEAAAAEQAAQMIRTVAEAAELRLEAGDISAYEARRLRIELLRVEQELADAALRARAARRLLAALVEPEGGRLEVGPVEGFEGVPPPIGREAALGAIAGRPDLEAAERHADAAAAALAVASAAWVPQPILNVGYKEQADGFTGATFGVDLPLPLLDRGRGGRDGVAARESAARGRLELLRRQAEVDILNASDRYASARARFEAPGDVLLADADALLASARVAYVEGEMALVEVLDAAAAFRDARLTALSFQAGVWVAYYDLLRAMARAPEVEG